MLENITVGEKPSRGAKMESRVGERRGEEHTRGLQMRSYTVIRFVSISAKFGICTVVGLDGTLAEAKIRTWDT